MMHFSPEQKAAVATLRERNRLSAKRSLRAQALAVAVTLHHGDPKWTWDAADEILTWVGQAERVTAAERFEYLQTAMQFHPRSAAGLIKIAEVVEGYIGEGCGADHFDPPPSTDALATSAQAEANALHLASQHDSELVQRMLQSTRSCA